VIRIQKGISFGIITFVAAFILWALGVCLAGSEFSPPEIQEKKEEEQGLNHYIQLAEKVGFKAYAQKEHGSWFFLALKK
jgi:hypothetical protein